jgi:hypothetical protein
MFIGDSAKGGRFAYLLGAMAADAADSGATAISCRMLRDGRIEFLVSPPPELTVQWWFDGSSLGPSGGSPGQHIWDIAAAVCLAVEWRESGAIFAPDLEVFPYLGPFSPLALMGVVNDLATAFPNCHFEVADERTGLRTALQYRDGCKDRLRVEGGERTCRDVLRFHGVDGEVAYDIAVAWCHGPGLQVVALVNGDRAANGGCHVQGVWEGVADALNARLEAQNIRSRRVDLMDIPRNALLVVSVHLDQPKFGAATRDCLHDQRARDAVRAAIGQSFFAELGEEVARGANPPWQLLAGFHHDTPWLERFPEELSDDSRPGARDPFHHHPGDES